MSKIPPLLPSEALPRVLRLAHFDGTSVLVIAAVFAFASAAVQDRLGAVVGILVAGTGALELHGAGLLHHAQSRGMRWLVVSQIGLMAVILGYVAFQMQHADGFTSHLPTDLIQQLATQEQLPVTTLRHELSAGTGFLIGFVTLLYQGGMTIYYLRRWPAILAALG